LGLYLTLFAFGLADLWIYFLVALALGMVIFVHELGHFVVAKLCGVQCDKFYLGFDIGGLKLFKFRWGETEYGIGILPLGGYVKMLGQEDNPARLREEIERARTQQGTGDPSSASELQPTESELREAEQALYNPRSYLAKSVPQRMAIISAGVIMNMLFAFLTAVLAVWYGVYQPACGVGYVIPGQNAWINDIRPGDEIISIAGKPTSLYQDLVTGISLGNLENGISMEIRRPGVAEPIAVVVHPDRLIGKPTIGVTPPQTTSLLLYPEIPPTWAGSPAAEANPGFEPGDEIVAVDGQPVTNVVQLEGQLVEHSGKPLEFTVARKVAGKRGSSTTEQAKIRVEPNPVRQLGLVMGIGDITAVQKGSPAEKAGLKAGDRIQSVDGKPLGNPLSLPDRWRDKAGQTVTVNVVRQGSKNPIDIPVTLRKADWIERPWNLGNPIPFPALGVTYEVLNRVQSVDADSPAAKAGVKPGQVLVQAEIIPPKTSPKRSAVKVDFSEKERNWPIFFYKIQDGYGSTVRLVFDDHQTVELTPVPATDWFNPDRGLRLDIKQVKVVAHSFTDAMRMGKEQTTEATMMVYNILGKLGTKQISMTQLAGPIGIISTAAYAAREGLPKLYLFLTLLSANLAVINFLPIPVLDGGHMVFLLYEGIVRKPVSERVQLALTYAGLLFVLGLMIFVVGLDISKLFGQG
jgi:regulator of sigma E protease